MLNIEIKEKKNKFSKEQTKLLEAFAIQTFLGILIISGAWAGFCYLQLGSFSILKETKPGLFLLSSLGLFVMLIYCVAVGVTNKNPKELMKNKFMMNSSIWAYISGQILMVGVLFHMPLNSPYEDTFFIWQLIPLLVIPAYLYLSDSESDQKSVVTIALVVGMLSVAFITSLVEKNPFYLTKQPEPLETVLSNIDGLFPNKDTRLIANTID